MQLTFWGAARTVTGSKHLLELDDGTKLLLDCGLFHGRRAEAWERNTQFGFDASTVDAVLLSHAHIDHAGLLPRLWKEGFRGRIYATHATYDLCSLMLRDSAYLQEKDVAFVNKIHARKGKPPIEPLYTIEDAESVMEHFVGVSYRQPFSPAAGVTVEYRDAGHILGAASMVLRIEEKGRTVRLGFTGDVGRPKQPILRDPQPMPACDVFITESTYGGMAHDPPDRSKERLAEIIERTSDRGGKVIIPAFAVGRTQEIIYALDRLWTEGRLPSIPVFVDSPLAVNATSVYLAHPECFDRETLDVMKCGDRDPLGFDRLTYIRDVAQSKKLNGSRVPMVIIAASGMCEGGRILHHLRHNIADAKNTIVMVGYCADHTLGKRIIERRPEVNIFGEPHSLRAEVEVMNGYSAHADEAGLLDFIDRIEGGPPERIVLVHGAPERQEALAATLAEHGFDDVVIPEHGASFTL